MYMQLNTLQMETPVSIVRAHSCSSCKRGWRECDPQVFSNQTVSMHFLSLSPYHSHLHRDPGVHLDTFHPFLVSKPVAVSACSSSLHFELLSAFSLEKELAFRESAPLALDSHSQCFPIREGPKTRRK